MRKSLWVFGIVLIVLPSVWLWAQSDVSLRGRIVSDGTQQMAMGQCGVEFVASPGAGQDPETVVCLGTSAGAVFYAYPYPSGGAVRRVGQLWLGASITDVDWASGASASAKMLALARSDGYVYVLGYQHGATPGLVPYGLVNAGARRVQIERLSSGSYLVAVGTTNGRLRVYSWLPGAPASSPWEALSWGTALVDVPLYAGAVSALRVWQVSGVIYIAVGGPDGVVYLYRWDAANNQLVSVGKAMYHPTGVAEMVVSGSRLIVGLTSGLVYVWNYTASSVSHAYTIKEPWAALGAHSLSAVGADAFAVATAFVRVYRLSDGVQIGEYGGGIWGNFLRDHYWAWQFGAYLWQSYFYRLEPVRVLPQVGAGNYFVVTAPGWGVAYQYNGVSRTAFMASGGLSYTASRRSYPVYALAYAGNGVVSGYADGYVQAPWGSRSLGAPVFALESFASGATTWLLGSYGVGSVFAWSSGGGYVGNVLPAPSAPRIVYGLKVLSVSGSEVVFATSGGDGRVELWRWTIGSTAPATLLSSQVVSRPLHVLSVNADRSELAVSWNVAYRSSGASAWRIPVSGGTTLGSPVALGEARVVAYHPTDPNLLAVGYTTIWQSGTPGSLWIYNRSTNNWRFLNGAPGRWWAYNVYILFGHTALAWASSDTLVSAWHEGYVGVWWTGADSVTNAYAPDGANWNPYRGGFDRALQEVYEPHRDRVYALLVVPNGDIVTGGADGRVVRWSRGGRPVYSSWYLSWLNSVDFSPLTGKVVYPGRVLLSPTQHALTWMPGFDGDFVSLALNIPGGSSSVQARVLSPWVVQDVLNDDVVVGYLWHEFRATRGPYRVEASEDGRWALLDAGLARVQVGSSYVRRWSFYLIPDTRLFQLAQASDFYQVDFPDVSSNDFASNVALSPSGSRAAMGLWGAEIRVYDRSGSSWSFSTPSSTISITSPQYMFLKFLADDVLAVAYPEGNPSQLKVDVYQLSGSSWVLRSSVVTGLAPVLYYIGIFERRYVIDAVASPSQSGVVRVAVAGANGLVFYKLTRSGGVASLTEVGRSSWGANGFLDVGGHTWVRFSRYNPNYLGCANGSLAVVYDLTGLFSW